MCTDSIAHGIEFEIIICTKCKRKFQERKSRGENREEGEAR
jgi:predicted metal-binding protein